MFESDYVEERIRDELGSIGQTTLLANSEGYIAYAENYIKDLGKTPVTKPAGEVSVVVRIKGWRKPSS